MFYRLVSVENGYAQGILCDGVIETGIRDISMRTVLLAVFPMRCHATRQDFENEEGVPDQFGWSRNFGAVSSRRTARRDFIQ